MNSTTPKTIHHPREKEYVDHLFRVVSNPSANVAGAIREAVQLVVIECREKMENRLRKVRKRLECLDERGEGDFAICHDVCSTVTISEESEARNLIGIRSFPVGLSLASFLQDWFAFIVYDRDIANWTRDTIRQVLFMAYSIGKIPRIDGILDGSLLDRIRKLGDYYTAI